MFSNMALFNVNAVPEHYGVFPVPWDLLTDGIGHLEDL
jgi:hypothetical protein